MSLFNRRPASEVSMADVAREAGVSKALAFRYFENKRALFIEAITETITRMEEGSDPDPELPADERFRDGLSGHLAVTERYPHAMRSFMAGDLGRDPEVKTLISDMDARVVDRIVARLGVPDPTPALRFAVRSWVHFVGACNMEWLERHEVSRDELIELEILTFRTVVSAALGVPAVPTAPSAGPPYLP